MTPPAVARLPGAPGVYRFRGPAGRVLYVGRATDLRSRVRSYWGDLRDRPRLRRMVPLVERVEAVPCASVHEAAWLERNLLEAVKPRWNRVRGGLEAPTVLVLDPGPRTPGLRPQRLRTPVPDGHEIFGPYLGGTTTRLALDALHRARPLAHAGTARTPAEADLAVARGVPTAPLVDLVADVRAVLRGDEGAIARCTADLVAHRDRAAAALRFEVAGRVQQEIDALAWLTSTQRVTALDGPDLVVHGWSAGTLVTFTVARGRVVRWQQAPCTPARGEALVAATPDAWRGFAAGAAELAAALLGASGSGPRGVGQQLA